MLNPRFCLQSGSGVNFLFLAWQTLGELPANFSANFDGEFILRIFRPCFSRGSGPKKNSRPNLSALLSNFIQFLEPKMFYADFLLTGETKRCAISLRSKSIASKRQFSLRLKRANFIPSAEFLAIPESAVKNRQRMAMRDFGAVSRKSHPAAKGGRQKGIGKKVTKNVKKN